MGLRGAGVGRPQTLTPRVDHQLSFLGSQKATRPLTTPKQSFECWRQRISSIPFFVIC